MSTIWFPKNKPPSTSGTYLVYCPNNPDKMHIAKFGIGNEPWMPCDYNFVSDDIESWTKLPPEPNRSLDSK